MIIGTIFLQLIQFTDAQSLVEKYGIGGLLLGLVIYLIISMFRSKWFGDFMGKVSDKFVEKFMKDKTKNVNTHLKLITDSDITNHDIFNYIDLWVYSKVPTLQFSTEYRTAVFRKYLTIYLKSYKTKINEFVDSKEYQNMDDSKIWKALLDLINQIIFDYEKEMTSVCIPTIVMEKMKTKNNDTINLTIDLIEGICSSQFYESDNNLLKVYSTLNILLSVLENTISGAESVCNSINGSLKGLSYISPDGKVHKEP